jgi:hypothetical protein
MLAAKPLSLIAVNDGRAGDFFWISMDGDAETCSPGAFVDAFPQTSCVVIDGDSSESPQRLANLVAQRIGAADVCLVDSHELFAFTKNEDVYRQVLSGAIARLPDRAS